MYHIIYKTLNTLNNRFYIGMHSTDAIEDGYLGSGKRLKREITKYGRDVFTREILAHAASRDELELLEADIVNDELLRNPFCLNLKRGGEGGRGTKLSEETKRKIAAASSKQQHTPERRAYMSRLRMGNTFGLGNKSRRGQKQGPEERARKSASLTGRVGWKPTPEQKLKTAEGAKKRPLVSCVQCHREMKVNNFTRHMHSHDRK